MGFVKQIVAVNVNLDGQELIAQVQYVKTLAADMAYV